LANRNLAAADWPMLSSNESNVLLVRNRKLPRPRVG
jgi:hypothetical protein